MRTDRSNHPIWTKLIKVRARPSVWTITSSLSEPTPSRTCYDKIQSLTCTNFKKKKEKKKKKERKKKIRIVWSSLCSLSKSRLKIWTRASSKAHKVSREILLYIQAQFAFKLGHVNFPTCINCLHAILYSLPAITKHTFPTFVVLKIPQVCNWVIH